MEMKFCNTCKATKSLNLFYRKGTKHQAICIECMKTYHKQHYLDNKEAYKSRARVRNKITRSENHRKVLEYLQNHPCIDCGIDNPVVLHFDHTRDKKDNVSGLIRLNHSWKTISAEIEKCEVRCANCHSIKTARDFHWYSHGWVSE